MRSLYLYLFLLLMLLATGTLAGCDTPAPPTVLPTDAPPTEAPPATALLPTATSAPAPGPSPTAPPPTQPPAPTPAPLGAIDLLGPLAALRSYELGVSLDVKSPETGRVSLSVANEFSAASQARRITLKGHLDDEPVDLVIVEAEGLQFVNTAGQGWQAVDPASEPNDYTSFAQSVYDEVLANLEADLVGTETVEGREALHYRFPEEEIIGAAGVEAVALESAAAEAWVAPDSGLVLRSRLHLQGSDREGNAYLVQIETALRRIDEDLTIAIPTATEPPPGETLAAADLLPLAEWPSGRIDAVLEIAADARGTLSAEYEFSTDPAGARVLMEMAIAEEPPASIEVIEAGGETFVDQDATGDWFVTPSSLREVLEGQDLAWLVDPLALLRGTTLTYAGATRDGGLSVARYTVAPEAVAANLPFGAVTIEEGEVEVWVVPETLSIRRLHVVIAGLDNASNPFDLALESEASDVGAPVEILPPSEEATIRPSDQWPAALGLGDVRTIEDLPSARLYVYLLRIGAGGTLNAEILHETDAPNAAERLVIAAWRDETMAFSDLIQIGDETWIDDGGAGDWQPSDVPIAERTEISAISTGQFLAPLTGAQGQFVGLETVHGMEAGHYTWGAEALAGVLGEGVAIEEGRADAWISPLHEVPVQIHILARGGGETLFLQWVATELGEDLGIAPPDAQYCPQAASLQMDETASATLAAGATTCLKFVAVVDEAITLRMGADDPNLDTALNIHDSDGNYVHYNDDGPDSLAPLLTFRPLRTGLYYAEVEGFDSEDAGPFTISLTHFDAEGTTTFDEAQVLAPGAATRAAITETSLLYIESHEETIYGHVYAFDGARGDEISVTVIAEALGSRLDPRAILLGPNLEALGSDDDSHGGLDARLDYVLRESGRHYVIVRQAAGEPYGTEETHFYEITLTIGE
jgi:hypothetical protein